MNRKRFTGKRIIGVPNEAPAVAEIADLAPQRG